jgi:tRNA pseudouridine55 synthase
MGDKLNGILLIDKPTDITSFGVVAKVRKKLQIKKIGHTGTLDPNATGLLILLIDKATKLLPYVDYHDKTYEFTMKLGIKTTTGDIWGDVIANKDITDIDQKEIEQIAMSFIGPYDQLPPMVSAIKVDGKKLYEYAREDKTIERKTRSVNILSLSLVKLAKDQWQGRVTCSKGTYIRTLCEDIAEKCNNIATMSSLRRTSIANISVDQAYTLTDLEKGDFKLLDPKTVLVDYKFINYDKLDDIYNGRDIYLDITEDSVFIENNDELLALYQRQDDNRFHCIRGLW